ncbi:MAG TPA: tyrosine-type recombinase/integrase [Candidatus Acidoferrales bacterium]|jgi:integrase/recombinase XerD|nr:tyrosine-type recombinase/integrase [Candidatus Acidoferrales bacterium]
MFIIIILQTIISHVTISRDKTRYNRLMLTPHRRHLKSCEHVDKGWNYTLCACPLWCDGTLHGKRFRKSLDTASWDRALLRIQALERGDAEVMPDQPAKTVAVAVEQYFADAVERALQPSSIRSQRQVLNQLVAAYGSMGIGTLTVDRLTDLRKRNAPIAPRTQQTRIRYLRAFCTFCIRRGWLTANPAKLLVAPEVADVATLPYTDEEIGRLLEACDSLPGHRGRARASFDVRTMRQEARALVLTLLYTGLRVSDVVQLKRSALEASGHLVLRVMKTGVPLKVLLHADAASELRALPIPANGNLTYFFWDGKCSVEAAPKLLWSIVHRVGVQAGVHAHPHRFRDTFAVTLLTNGVDIRTVQQLLGHTSITTTERHYAHFIAAHQALLDTAASTLNFSVKPARPLLVRNLGN